MRMIRGNMEVWQWVLLLTVLLPMAIKDFRIKKVNGYICLISILSALSIRVFVVGESDIIILLDLIPGVVFYIMSVATKGAVGKGDALVLMFIGSVMGFKLELTALLVSLLFSAAIALFLFAFRKAGKDTEIPFVPFLSIGVITGGLI